MLQNPVHVAQMQGDYLKIDFVCLKDQLRLTCENYSVESIDKYEKKFRDFHQDNSTLELWAQWMQGVVSECMGAFTTAEDYEASAKRLLLQWYYVSSLIIRDLTLRSAQSFGPFHLMRLLCDEYMYFLVELARTERSCRAISHTNIDDTVMAEPLSTTIKRERDDVAEPDVPTPKRARDTV